MGVNLLDNQRLSGAPGPAVVLGICVMIGLVAGGWLLGSQIKDIKLADRYVTVKGLVERTVKSDSAVWHVTFKEAGNDLSQVIAKSEANKNAVLKFMTEQGIKPQEIRIGQIQVTDKQANEFGNNPSGQRYIVQQTVSVNSPDVDKITSAGEKTAELVQSGVIIGGGYGQGIAYRFNGLNALKPDMITEATRNARAAAERFAADSGSHVGAIRSAKQGVFSITAADGTEGEIVAQDEGGTGMPNSDSSIMKKVRVVTTVDYYLVR